MNCSSEEPTVHFWTSALVPQSGGTADRGYRACKEVLTAHAGPAFRLVDMDDQGRYCYFKGRVPEGAISDIVERLDAALRRFSADSLLLVVQEMGCFFLNSGESAFFEPFEFESGG